MKIRILKILIPLSIIALAIIFNGGLPFNKNFTVKAVGDLVITWGVPAGDPIFVVSNMLPGDMEDRDVKVENNASTERPVGVRGVQTFVDPSNFPDVLEIEISDGSTIIYGPTTLEQFFADSSGISGLPLSTLGPGDSVTYNFKVTFDSSSGNDFQNAKVIFDLIIGIAIDIPSDCEDINFGGEAIFGTDGVDNLNGTTGNDLIVSFEENDDIEGNLGDDCILGNEGSDKLNGNNGNDVIFGADGNDEIHGNNGEDIIFGGSGNDNIKGNNEDDKIFGGDGNDNLEGENGDDLMEGQGGNDSLDGGNDNDNMDGGVGGTDFGDGKNGTDTCTNFETEINCE